MSAYSRWLCRISGVLSLGGGFVGITAIGGQLASGPPSPVVLVLSSVFLLLYIFGIIVGLLLLEGKPSGLSGSLLYWFLQTPIISNAWFSYQFSAGAHFYLIYGDIGFHLNWSLGSVFNLRFLAEGPQLLGINLIAVIFLVLLWRLRNTAVVDQIGCTTDVRNT